MEDRVGQQVGVQVARRARARPCPRPPPPGSGTGGRWPAGRPARPPPARCRGAAPRARAAARSGRPRRGASGSPAGRRRSSGAGLDRDADPASRRDQPHRLQHPDRLARDAARHGVLGQMSSSVSTWPTSSRPEAIRPPSALRTLACWPVGWFRRSRSRKHHVTPTPADEMNGQYGVRGCKSMTNELHHVTRSHSPHYRGVRRMSHPPLLVVMGVSGSGKSTVGAALAQRLGVPFVDADDLHPAGQHRQDDARRGPRRRRTATPGWRRSGSWLAAHPDGRRGQLLGAEAEATATSCATTSPAWSSCTSRAAAR